MSKYHKISLVINDLAGGITIRAYILAQALKKLNFKVEIIGFLFGKSLFSDPPSDIPVFSVIGGIYPRFLFSAQKLLKKIDGDIIYALKPRPTSFGISLLKKIITHRPLILDMDDWELGWYGGDDWRYQPTIKQFYADIFKSRYALRFPDFPLYLKWMEKFVHMADALTVDTKFLKEQFGGVYLPNGKDTSLFDPLRFNAEETRIRYGLNDYKILMFPGAVRPHKGLEDILIAMDKLNRLDLRLVIVGKNPYDDYEDILINRWRRWIIKLPERPFEGMPEIISAAHIVVVPQRDTLGTRSQFPLKLTDGMAMAKPLLATKVGDIPEILDETGYLVKPGNPAQIAEKIEYILGHPDEANEKGKKARQRCQAYYSVDVMAKILSDVITNL